MSYQVIEDWMLDIEGLNTAESLAIFAVINGFSQDDNGAFYGSAEYLAKWARCSCKTVYRKLAEMVDAGLVIKKEFRDENGAKRCEYRIARHGSEMMDQTLPETKPTKKSKRFSPPTRDEVAAYCEERGNGIEPDRFVDYYESKGWVVGKARMKDWRAAVRTWEQRDAADGKPKPKPDRLLEPEELMRLAVLDRETAEWAIGRKEPEAWASFWRKRGDLND